MSIQDTKIQIVDTAIDLFWRASYHATNMNDLSRIAGVNKATVYSHFRSKEQLAVAAVARATDRTIEYVFEGAFEAYEQPVDRLREIYKRIHISQISAYQHDGLSRGCPFVNMGVELATSNDDVREAVQNAFERLSSYYKKIVDDLRTAGTLTQKGSTDELAADLQDNMNASLVRAKLSRNADAILNGGERAIRYLTA